MIGDEWDQALGEFPLAPCFSKQIPIFAPYYIEKCKNEGTMSPLFITND